jgi:glycerol-3-phosphate cytidylyltransferase
MNVPLRVKSPASLLAWRRQTSESVVVVTGTFDIFQPGNLYALKQAALLAKRIIVVVEPDEVVAAHSSIGRPQNKFETRVEMVSHLRNVDAVTSISVAEAKEFFAELKPFIWVTSKLQKSTEVYADGLMASAERVVEVMSQEGGYTEDVIAAIAENRTPIQVATAWAHEAGESRMVPVSVTVNGCFDILHIGHLRLLSEARGMGDSLTVLINSDVSVSRYKGALRPVFPETFRAAALKSLRSVDDVLVFEGDNPLKEIQRLRPRLHVKGGSYEPERVRAEREILESWGGRLVCTAMVEGFSTTDYIRKALGA